MISDDELRRVASQVETMIDLLPVEVAVLVPLRGGVPGDPHVLAVGDAGSVLARPRDVFRLALMLGADAAVLLHSHRADDSPSSEDLAVTRRLVAAGVLMGIPLAAHVILGPGTAWECISGGRIERAAAGTDSAA